MKKAVIIIAACILAAAVLVATLMFGPSSRRVDKNAPGNAAQPPTVGLDPGGSTVRHTPVRYAGAYHYTRINNRGQLIEVFGDTLQPRPQGVLDVTNPGARIHFTPSRVLEIRAEKGTFIAPDNKPRQGEFFGPVVVTLFDGPHGRPLALDTDADVQLRMFMRDARFDLELGKVESVSKIHLTGPRFDFTGKGLNLVYSELRNRIERLEISEGDTLRLTNAVESRPEQAGTQPAGPTTKPARKNVIARYYRATLDREVRIKSRELDIEADHLLVLFGAGDKSGHDQILDPSKRAEGGSVTQPAPTPEAQRDARAAGVGPLPRETTLATASDTDTLVRWSGPLVLVPEETAPPELADANDVFFRLDGKLVKIDTARKESIRVARLEYQFTSGATKFIGDDKQPFVLDSPSLGVLTGPALVIDQERGFGQVLGTGTLKAHEPAPGTAGAGAGLPPGSVIAWTDRLDLVFINKPPVANKKREAAIRLAGLASATFRGQVKINGPELALSADLLSIGMSDPAKGRSTLDSIHAAGAVKLSAREERNSESLDLASDTLDIELTKDGDRVRPSRLLAKDNVVVTQPQRRIQAGMLDVTLTAGPAPAEGDKARKVAVASILASRAVRAEIDNQNIIAVADQLKTDGKGERIELIGAADAPASLSHPDGSLKAQRITLHQPTQVIEVDGAGTFDFKHEASSSGQPAAAVVIRWSKSMRFDNRTGEADFVGDVIADSIQGRDTTNLTSGKLRVLFDTADKPAGSKKMPQDATAGRAVREIVADDDVTMTATNWTDRPDGNLATRVTLQGPRARFDNRMDTAEVKGAGKMLMEDYRPKANGETKTGPVQFTGRGKTLFTWTGQMNLDAAKNKVRFEQEVQMLHKPAEGAAMQLDCRVFDAELEGRAGGKSWLAGDRSTTGVRKVVADQDVRVLSDKRRIRTDRLEFDGGPQVIRLIAREGSKTEVIETDSATPISGSEFIWDLKKGTVEINDPGPGRVEVK